MVKYYHSLDTVFKALGSSVRRDMLRRIAVEQPTVVELAEPYEMSIPAVSKHIKVLEEAELVLRKKVGRCYYFQIDIAKLQKAQDWMTSMSMFWNQSFDSLERILEKSISS